jgi:hypothetical protein
MPLQPALFFWLVDLRSGRTLSEYPAATFQSRKGAAQAASHQARRFAALGVAVLLVEEGRSRAYLPSDLDREQLRFAEPAKSGKGRPLRGGKRAARTSSAQLELPLDAELITVPRRAAA